MSNPQRPGPRAYPVEDLLQALTAQLDRAQDALALKVRTGRPLTWALKDLTIDLQVFVEVDGGGRVLLRSAAPGETGASMIRFNLTSITRTMIEENTVAFQDDEDSRSIDDLRQSADIDDDERKKLEWAGVRTVGQLQRLSGGNSKAVETLTGIPADRLRAALEAASRPTVQSHETVQRRGGELLRIRGANLSDGLGTEVRLSGEPVEVVETRPHELLVRPLAHHAEGQIEVMVRGERATSYYRRGPARSGGDKP